MSDLDLLRNAAKEPASASSRARDRARARLTAKIDASERRLWRPSLLPLAGVVTTLAVALGVFLSIGGGGSHNAAAATVLRSAAKAALTDPSLETLKPGQYIYTKSESAYLNTSVYSNELSFSVLVPDVREIWLGPGGTGWLYETSGKPTFLSEHDRQQWIAAGRPDLGSKATDTALRNEDGSDVSMQSLDLPSDPDLAYARLAKEAKGGGSGLYEEMFVLIGDDLRESYTTPVQRAALFEVAARLPGVESIGIVKDSAGRTGIGVAMNDEANRIRMTLIFDSVSYALLGEEESVMSGSALGYPAGTVIGHATYLKQAVVDELKKRP